MTPTAGTKRKAGRDDEVNGGQPGEAEANAQTDDRGQQPVQVVWAYDPATTAKMAKRDQPGQQPLNNGYPSMYQVATSYVPSTTTSSASNNTVTTAIVDYANGGIPPMTQLPVSLASAALQPPHNAAITVTVDPQTTSSTAYTTPMGTVLTPLA